MKRTSRGFLFPIGRKMMRLWRWVRKPGASGTTGGYVRLNGPAPEPATGKTEAKMTTKICRWGQCLKRKFFRRRPSKGYSLINDGKENAAAPVPKGHLAVYVGEREDDTHRYLVPVVYFNHPLFGELLREAEEKYGFAQAGGITIPCRVAEFESVQKRIAGERGRHLRQRPLLSLTR